jgi:CBS domain-containing protein
VVLVQHILEAARKRLAVLGTDASVCDAAVILADPATPLVVVCDREGVAVGVISRTDVLKAIARDTIDVFDTTAGVVMSKAIVSCHADEALQRVWETLNARSLRSAPVLDSDGRPQGVVHARDLACALLDEVTQEEVLLRDYVLGVGYQ